MTTENGKPTYMTLSGFEFNPFEPDPEHLEITDVAHGLAQTYRFNKQLPEPYSVAQHCVLVSEDVEWLLRQRRAEILSELMRLERTRMTVERFILMWSLCGHMHEVGESHSGFGDVPAPVKRHPMAKEIVKGLESLIEGAAEIRWGLPVGFAHAPIVKASDTRILLIENRDIRKHNIPKAPDQAPITITHLMPWQEAKVAFLARYTNLTTRLAAT